MEDVRTRDLRQLFVTPKGMVHSKEMQGVSISAYGPGR
jgi:hypothetical protein